MHILGKNLQIVNRYTETAYFMQKDSRIKKPDCTSQIPFSVIPCPICALKVALNMLKLPLRATFLPIRLALSGIFVYLQPKQAGCLTHSLYNI